MPTSPGGVPVAASLEFGMLTNRYLYVVSADAAPDRQAAILCAAIDGGADVVQLRNKSATPGELLAAARVVVAYARQRGAIAIVNDHLELAIEAGAHGVHLGQDDGSLAAARARCGPGMLLGRSTHSLHQALAAVADGADYLGVGPLFATPTKPGRPATGLGLVSEVAGAVTLPWFAIGGIDAGNIDGVLDAGAIRVAVVRAVCLAPDPIVAAADLKARLVAAPAEAPA
jgi:thiamine-phosphate pyrophosphorylase